MKTSNCIYLFVFQMVQTVLGLCFKHFTCHSPRLMLQIVTLLLFCCSFSHSVPVLKNMSIDTSNVGKERLNIGQHPGLSQKDHVKSPHEGALNIVQKKVLHKDGALKFEPPKNEYDDHQRDPFRAANEPALLPGAAFRIPKEPAHSPQSTGDNIPQRPANLPGKPAFKTPDHAPPEQVHARNVDVPEGHHLAPNESDHAPKKQVDVLASQFTKVPGHRQNQSDEESNTDKGGNLKKKPSQASKESVRKCFVSAFSLNGEIYYIFFNVRNLVSRVINVCLIRISSNSLSPLQEHQSMPHLMPLPLADLQPPDHVEGVHMEQDGHLNRDYKKEILFGNHHDEFERASEVQLTGRLKVIFNK